MNNSVSDYANKVQPLVTDRPFVALRREIGAGRLATPEATEDFIGETLFNAGMDFLASLKSSPEYFNHPDIAASRKEEQRIRREQADKLQDEGLTTEINTNRGHIGIRDTLENCAAILARHPFGYREKWTDDENKEAEQQMAALVTA